jgi:hypothetical protein
VGRQRFDAELKLTGKTGTYVEIPFDARDAFGSGRPPVRGTINGAALRSTLAPYGEGWFLPVNRKLRDAAGVGAGETVRVELERDDEPRTVDLPPELAAALARDGAARAAFDRLSYSHRREYAEWIGEAKREETRERRAGKALGMLREGRTAR